MNLGLVLSALLHLGLLAWALVTIQSTPELRRPQEEAVAVAIVTPDELTRLRKGDRNAKQLDAEAKQSPRPDPPQKEAPKPTPKAATTPPPPAEPPPEPQKAEPVPEPVKEAAPPEPPKPEPAKAEPPRPDPIADKMAALAKEPPPAPTPAPGPTPEEQKALEAKLEAERKAAEDAKRKAEEEARRKAAEAKKKADDLKKKQLADAAKKKADEEKKKREAEAKKKAFDPNNISALLNKIPDKGGPAPEVERSELPSKNKGPVAGAAEGRDTRLTASEMSLIAAQIRQGVQPCWRVLGGGQGAEATAVKMRIQFNQDGTLAGDPQIMNPQGTAFFIAAAESAKRAVVQCQPYSLPAAKYAFWKDVILNFDPKDMF